MKFNLKEALIKYHLLKEGWMEELEGQYDEDLLIFVGRIIQKVYPVTNISDYKLAPWIAKVTKEMGKAPYDISDSKMKSVVHALETILKYIKSENDSNEAFENIISKEPEDAYFFAKEQLEKTDEEEYPESLQNMLDDNNIKIVKKLSDGRIWVEVLDKSFFDEYLSRENRSLGKYGIACQTDRGPGAKFVGGSFQTFTLLGKIEDGFYSKLVSIALDNDSKSFREIKDAGNIPPGRNAVKGWNDLAEVSSDYIVQNLSDINKYYEWNGNRIPEQCGSAYGASSTFCFWLDKKPNIIEKIITRVPETLDYMEPLIRNVKPDFLENINIDFENLLKSDPNKFFNKLNVYISKVQNDLEDLLRDFDFENFYKTQSGKDSLKQALNILIEKLPIEFFMDKIYPFIDFKEILSHKSESSIKEILISIRNKYDKNQANFLKVFEKMYPDFIYAFGGGLKGFSVIQNFLDTPRLPQHQNFRKKNGAIVASVERDKVDDEGNLVLDTNGNRMVELVDIKIPEDDKVLSSKNIRNFYKKYEDWIKSNMSGTEEEKEIKFLRYILINSSEQARGTTLKKEKEKLISYYDEEYKNGKIKIPGIIYYNTLINPKIGKLTNQKNFSDDVKSYKFDKKELNSNNFQVMLALFKYYISKSNSETKERKLVDAIVALFDNLKFSSFSKDELNEIIFDKFSLIKLIKTPSYDIIINYVNNLKEFTELRAGLIKFLESKEIKEIVYRKSREYQSTVGATYKKILDNLKSNTLDESKIRKYIANLLRENFKK